MLLGSLHTSRPRLRPPRARSAHLRRRCALCTYAQARCLTGRVQVDVWALGLVVCELVLGRRLWEDGKGCDAVDHVRSMCEEVEHGAPRRPLDASLPEWRGVSHELRQFAISCLQIDPKQRPHTRVLMQHDVFAAVVRNERIPQWVQKPALWTLIGEGGERGQVVRSVQPRTLEAGALRRRATRNGGRLMTQVQISFTCGAYEEECWMIRSGNITAHRRVSTVCRACCVPRPY